MLQKSAFTRISKILLTMLWIFWLAPALPGQQSPVQCLGNIQKRLEALGNQTDFDFLKMREIMRQSDYGQVPAAIADVNKASAFKRVITSLSEFCDLAGTSLSAKGMRGYTRFSGGIIRSNGTDFVAELKKVFGGSSFDAPGFNEVMEFVDVSGDWPAPGRWESPGGLVYRTGSTEGHRISHILAHSIDDPSKPSHGVWNLSRKNILIAIDDAWNNKPTVQDVTQGNRRLVIKNYGSQVGMYDSGYLGGNTSPASMKHVAFVIENGSEIITAYPLSTSYRFP